MAQARFSLQWGMLGRQCSHLKVCKIFHKTILQHLFIDPSPEDKKGVKHAVLVGVISTSQYLAESKETSTHRRQMSEQVSYQGEYRE